MSLLPLVLTVVLGAIAFKAAPRVALGALLVTVLLIPDTAFLPGSVFNNLPVYRLVLGAFVAGLVARVINGQAPSEIFRPGRVHALFAGWLAGSAIIGIALAEPGLAPTPRYQSFLLIVDQALVFVGVVACVRLIGSAWSAVKVLALVAAGSVAIATSEQLLGWSYARWVLTRPGLRTGVLGAQQLELRGDSTRVRAAAQFSLGYAWTTAILLPLLLARALQARSRLAWALPALAGLTIVWTQSRSPLPAIALGIVAVAALSGFRRRIVVFAVVLALGGSALYLAEPSLRDPFTSEGAKDSDRSRGDRQATGLDRAAERPVLGHALGSIEGRFGLHGLDLEYLTVYVELGVVGLVLLVSLLVGSLLACGKGLRAPPARSRTLAAATTTAAVLGIAAAAAYDFLHIPGSALPFWVVIAIGVAHAELAAPSRGGGEDAPAPLPTVRETLVRAALPLGCLGVGGLLAATAPASAEWTAMFETLPVHRSVTADGDFDFTGKLLSEDACHLVRALEPRASKVRCLAFPESGGLGQLTWRGPSAEVVRMDAFETVTTVRRAFPGFRGHPITPAPVKGRPTWRTTAPAWMTLAGGVVALSGLLPIRRRERSEVEHAVLDAPGHSTGPPGRLPGPVPTAPVGEHLQRRPGDEHEVAGEGGAHR